MKTKTGLFLTMGLLALWIFVAFCPVYAESESILLHFQPKVGQTFRTAESIDFKMKIPGLPFFSNIKIAYAFGYTFQILNVEPDGSATSHVKIHAVKTEFSGFLGPGETYDSTDPFQLPSQTGLPFALLDGCEFEMTLDPSGRVTDIHISEQYQDKLTEYLSGNNEEQKAKIRETIQQSMSRQMGKSNNQFTEGIYRQDPVKVGEKWEQIVEQDANGILLKMKMTYWLKNVSEGVAHIDFTAQIMSFKNTASNSALNFDHFKGNAAGKIEALVDSGYIVRSNLTLKMEGSIKPNGGNSQRFSMEGLFLTKPFEENARAED